MHLDRKQQNSVKRLSFSKKNSEKKNKPTLKKRERIWVCSHEVDEPRTYYTELSESERER